MQLPHFEVISDGYFEQPPGFYRLRERIRVPAITEPMFNNAQHARCRIAYVWIKEQE